MFLTDASGSRLSSAIDGALERRYTIKYSFPFGVRSTTCIAIYLLEIQHTHSRSTTILKSLAAFISSNTMYNKVTYAFTYIINQRMFFCSQQYAWMPVLLM